MAMARGGILGALLRQKLQRRLRLLPASPLLLCRRNYSNKLFVGGLSFRTDEEAVRKAFSQHGDVVEVKLITDRETGRPKGFGFVTFNSDDAAENARSKMTGQLLDGRMIRVDKAAASRPPAVSSSSFSGMGSSSFSSPSSAFSGSGASSGSVDDWGAIPSNAVDFGGTTGQSSFPSDQGTTGVGSSNPTGFGSSNATGFGSSNAAGVGSSNPTGFGSANATGFGSANATGFGSANATGVGSANPTGFGSSNATGVGSSSATGFGSINATGDGSSNATSYGNASSSGFGSSTISTSSNTTTATGYTGSGFTSSSSSFGVQKVSSDDWGSIPSNSVDLSSIGQINSSGISGVISNTDSSNQASTGQTSGGFGATTSGNSGTVSSTNLSGSQAASVVNNSGINTITSTAAASDTSTITAPPSSSSTTASASASTTTPSAHPLNSPALTSSGSFNFSNFSFDSTSYRDNDPPLPRRRPRPRPRTMNQSSSGMGLNLNSGTGSILETMSPFGSNNQYAETSIPKFKGPEYDFGMLDLTAVSKSEKRPQGVFDIDIPDDLPEPPPPEPPKPKPTGLPLFPQKQLPSLDLPWNTPEADNWSEIGEDPPKYDLSSLFPSMGELIKKEKEFHWDPYDFDEEAKAVLPPEEEVIEIDSDYD